MARSSAERGRWCGLTHVALAVRDAERALGFYRQVLGVVPVDREAGFIQAQTPGSRDVLVFKEGAPRPGVRGGIAHFGFRLVDPADIELAVEAIRAAGGTIRERGEFCPGEPYVFFIEPDGYEVEIWHELRPRSILDVAPDRPATGRRCALPVLDPTGHRCQQGRTDLVAAQRSKAGGA